MKSGKSENIRSANLSHSAFFQKESNHFFSKNSKSFFNAPAIQPKLTVNEPGDKYEQEADSMADKVVQRLSNTDSPSLHSPASNTRNKIQTKPYLSPTAITQLISAKPIVQHATTPSIQTKCASCEQEYKPREKEEDPEPVQGKLQKKAIFESNAEPPDDDKNIQRKCADCEKEESNIQASRTNDSAPVSLNSIESNLNASRGAGNPLTAGTRRQMEDSFGTDFSGVRLHTGDKAVQMNKDLNAQAFTHGNDIYFNSGKQENTSSGKYLLAHELTHVVQQRGENKIQRFTEAEHKRIVDEAIAEVRGTNLVELVPGYTVTAGDITAMTGDHFKSKQQIIDFLNNPDPDGPNSKEEVEYVRFVMIRGDATKKEAFNKKAESNEKTKKAIENADQRYYALAGQNKSHFPYPGKGDELLPISELAEKWASSKDLADMPNAIAGYRRYHIQALLEAYQEGFTKQALVQSLATDSSAYHFLTDSFSAGHVQTPRASLTAHWHSRVPMFNHNLKGYISNQVAAHINNNIDKILLSSSGGLLVLGALTGGTVLLAGSILASGASLLLTENYIYEKVLPIVTEKIDATGKLNFGDVVSGALHDYYNANGVVVKINDKETTIYGDSSLDKHVRPGEQSSDTRYYASEAVKLSYFELEMARQMGVKGQSMLDLLSLKKDGLFAAETLIPKPTGKILDPSGNVDKPIQWEYDTVEKLLDDPKFVEALKLFAKEKSNTFKEVIGGLKLEGAMKILKPLVESAFREKVIKPLESDTLSTITSVINWTPDTGGGLFGHDEDDKALEYVDKTKQEGDLKSLTLEQKARLIKQITGGFFSVVFADEEQAIVDLFENTAGSERKKLYGMVEGHAWQGDFKEGWFTWDDELYNSLSGSRLKRVRDLINEK